MKAYLFNLATIGLFLLPGCVSMSQPIAIGTDTYMVTLNARGGFQSDGDLLAQSVERAREFCTGLGRTLEVQTTNTSGIQGWTPQNNRVVFHCAEK